MEILLPLCAPKKEGEAILTPSELKIIFNNADVKMKKFALKQCGQHWGLQQKAAPYLATNWADCMDDNIVMAFFSVSRTDQFYHLCASVKGFTFVAQLDQLVTIAAEPLFRDTLANIANQMVDKQIEYEDV